MIKTVITHYVYDMFVKTLFDGFINTFTESEPSSNIPTVGKFYSKVTHVDGYETFYNCVVRNVEMISDTKYFVRIAFEYVNDMNDVEGFENDTMTSQEFSDVYSVDDSDIDIEDIETVDDLEEEGVDLILNEDNTVSLSSDYYVFIT